MTFILRQQQTLFSQCISLYLDKFLTTYTYKYFLNAIDTQIYRQCIHQYNPDG